MKIGLLCPSDEELAPFLPRMEEREETKRAGLCFHTGWLEGVETAAVYSGVCKVNAAIAAQLLIEFFHVETLLLAGTAGGMDPQLKRLDTVVSTETAHHDVEPDILTDYHPWMESEFFPADAGLLALAHQTAETLEPRRPVFFGRMVTGEAFIDQAGRQSIWQRYAPMAVDMETAAVAQVCRAFGVPFLAVRTLTDTEEHSGAEEFEQNCCAASERAAEFTCALIRQIGLKKSEG